MASKPDAVGDLSLIFGYMKMLDPGSVVREGEFANAANAAGVPDRVWNLYNKVLKGERLNDQQRGAFKSQAKSLHDSASKREEEVRGGLEKVVKAYGLNAENVFSSRAKEVEPSKPVEVPRIKDDASYNALPSGAEFIAPDGSRRRKP